MFNTVSTLLSLAVLCQTVYVYIVNFVARSDPSSVTITSEQLKYRVKTISFSLFTLWSASKQQIVCMLNL